MWLARLAALVLLCWSRGEGYLDVDRITNADGTTNQLVRTPLMRREDNTASVNVPIQKQQSHAGNVLMGVDSMGEVSMEGHSGVRKLANATPSKILLIGDSNAQFAGPGLIMGQTIPNTLQIACGGSTVINKGDGGTMANQWIANSGQWIKTAIASSSGWTHVWVSVGMNDLGELLSCGNKALLKSNLSTVVSHIKTLAPTAKIVFTGYAVSAADDTCSLSASYNVVHKAMQEIAAVDAAVTMASVATAADGLLEPAARAKANCSEAVIGSGSGSPLIGVPPCRGDKKYFHSDFIHLNAAGYAKAWALPAVQLAFGCSTAGPAPAPAPATPSPTAAPTCNDDNAGVIKEAASLGYSIGGCADVLAFCNDGTHGAKVRQYCPKTCGSCTR